MVAEVALACAQQLCRDLTQHAGFALDGLAHAAFLARHHRLVVANGLVQVDPARAHAVGQFRALHPDRLQLRGDVADKQVRGHVHQVVAGLPARPVFLDNPIVTPHLDRAGARYFCSRGSSSRTLLGRWLRKRVQLTRRKEAKFTTSPR